MMTSRHYRVNHWIAVLFAVTLINVTILLYHTNNHAHKNTKDFFLHRGIYKFQIFHFPRVWLRWWRGHGSRDNIARHKIGGKTDITEMSKSEFGIGNKEISFVINHHDVCANVKSLDLAILVASRPGNTQQRDVIRKTYAQSLRSKSKHVVILFILSNPNRQDVQERVNSENYWFRDIIQTTLEYNEVNNMRTIFAWMHNYCSNARFLFKTTDGVLIVNEDILAYVKVHRSHGKALGQLITNSQPDRNHHYETSNSKPVLRLMSSTAFLLSFDVVGKVYKASIHDNKSRFKDLYISRLLQASGIQPQQHPGINTDLTVISDSTILSVCQTRFEFAWGRFNASFMSNVWTRINGLECKNSYGYYPEEKVSLHLKDNGYVNNQFDYKFLSNHPTLCTDDEPIKSTDRNTTSLIIVTISVAKYEARRNAIRDTWGGYLTTLPGKRVYRVFIVGLSEDEEVNEKLLQEDEEFGDIIVVDITSSDRHKTLLTILALKWVHTFCSHVDFVMKTEDHVFINADNLIRYVETAPRNNFVVGSVSKNAKPVRAKSSQWYVSETLYQDSTYPPYPSGVAFIISRDVSNEFYQSAKDTRLFVFEDVYLGIILTEMDIEPTHHPGFDADGKKRSTCDLIHLIAVRCSLSDPPAFLYKYWREWQWSEFEECKSTDSTFSSITYKSKPVSDIVLKGQVSKPHSFEFLLNHPDSCKSNAEGVFLLIGVLSAPTHISTRNAIRETWGQYYSSRRINRGGQQIRVLFLLGVPPNDRELAKIVQEEDSKYGDIIQQSFIETYDHLVLKSLMLIKYAAEFCQNAKYVLKIDDDVFLNTFNLLSFLKNAPRSGFYLGDPLVGSEPLRTVRSKWYTPRHIWAQNTYPPYCAGPSYLISIDLAQKIYTASFRAKPFRWEDLYIGSLIASLGVAPYPHIHFDMPGIYRDRCSMRQAIVSHHIEDDSSYKYWSQLSHADHVINGICGDSYKAPSVPGFTIRDVTWTHQDNVVCSRYEAQPGSIFLLIVINTDVLDYTNRKWQRLSQMTSRKVANKQVVVMFLTENPEAHVRQFIRNENVMFGDINTFDQNSPEYIYKPSLLRALTWTNLNCKEFQYVMFIETNVFVNIENVVSHLVQKGGPHTMLGVLKTDQKVSRIPDVDNYVPRSSWPRDFFPPYCDSRVIIMSKYVSMTTYEWSKKAEVVAKDQSAILGILAFKAFIKPTDNKNILLERSDRPKINKNGKVIVEKVSLCDTSVTLATDIAPWGLVVQTLLRGETLIQGCKLQRTLSLKR